MVTVRESRSLRTGDAIQSGSTSMILMLPLLNWGADCPCDSLHRVVSCASMIGETERAWNSVLHITQLDASVQAA